MPKSTRTRRSPEQARALILEAATTVIARVGPDKAGLKAVAEEAGVSHGLVTHYFGTFDNLVEQVLEVRMVALREELIAAFRPGEALDPEAVVTGVMGVFARSENARLLGWAWLSGRMDLEDFHVRRARGLALVADAVQAATGAPRASIEEALVIGWSAVASYGVAREVLWASVGEEHTEAHDARIAAALARMLSASLTAPREQG